MDTKLNSNFVVRVQGNSETIRPKPLRIILISLFLLVLGGGLIFYGLQCSLYSLLFGIVMCLFGIYCGWTILLGFTLDYDKNILTVPGILGKHHIAFSDIARLEIARSGDGEKAWFVSICTTDGKSQTLMGELKTEDAELLREYFARIFTDKNYIKHDLNPMLYK